VRAHRLGRILNVSFKTAASMMRRLESAAAKMDKMDSADARGLLAKRPLSEASYSCGATPPF
jgi:hypothetical protein